MRSRRIWAPKSVLLLCLQASSASADPGNRLLATGGVSPIDGGAGGGLTQWSVIAGYGTREQIGFTAFASYAEPQDFSLASYGVAAGLFDRLEIAFAEQRFDLGTTVPGEQIRQRILGLKWRLFGDAVFDQDKWQPQVALGAQYRRNLDFESVPSALGARSNSGVDFYLAATKLFLDAIYGRNLLLNVGLRASKANQFGLLGYGGDRADDYTVLPEAAVGIFLSDALLLGGEYRAKPNNLSAFAEEDAKDVYLAWLPDKRVSVTAAYVDLGRIADKADQRAPYISVQVAF